MRVLVAGRNAKLLARTAGAFSNDLDIATATTKAAAFALLDYREFDLIIACETLGDGSGLDVLRQVAVATPNTLRIFAARPATLALLKNELGLFGLFRTLAYPINFRKLWAALNLARSCCTDAGPVMAAAQIAKAKLNARAQAVMHSSAASEPVKSTEPTELQRSPPVVQPPLVAEAHPLRVSTEETQQAPMSGSLAAPGMQPPARAQTPIRESEAFKRALARRNEEKLRRLGPPVPNESLVQLAKLAAARKLLFTARGIAGTRRTVFFVGSGVVAAGTLALLTLFMVGSNPSVGSSPAELVAGIDRPVPRQVLPWQPPLQQRAPAATAVANEVATPIATDVNAEGETVSEQFEMEPSRPPLPNPSESGEPPQYDASAVPVVE